MTSSSWPDTGEGMAVFEILDPDDDRLSDYRRLNDVTYRKEVEQAGPGPGRLIAEGPTVIARLLGSGIPVRSILLTPRLLDVLSAVVEGHDVPVFVVSQDVMNRVVGFPLHRGAVASASRPVMPPAAALAAHAERLAVLEGINDHENLGAVIRSAAALGFDGVILDRTSADPFYRRSVRVSMGGVFAIPLARAGDLSILFRELKRLGHHLVALTPADDALSIDDIPDLGGRITVMLGAEGPGLSPGAIAAADTAVRIPMQRAIDSLNVGHAAAIAFEHFRRRRR